MSGLTLTAGVGRANVTPPIGNAFGGYLLRVEPPVGVGTELYATALVLADERAKVAIVDCDLVGFPVDYSDELRAKIGAAIGTPASHVLLACTHNHNGPPLHRESFPIMQSAEGLYLANLEHYVVGAVKLADRNRRPARAAGGKGSAPIAVNRREELPDGTVILGQNPNGPTDHEVGVVRFDGLDGSPIACIVNYAAHPVVLGPEPHLLDSDYPGVARQVVEQATGATCLFLQGGAGDQMPIEAWRDDRATVRKIGGILGHEAVKVYLGIETRKVQVTKRHVKSLAEVLVYEFEETAEPTHTYLGAATRRVTLPRRELPSLAEAERTYAELKADLERQTSDRMRYIAHLELRWATRVLDRVKSGLGRETSEADVQAVRLDDVAILTAPGEPFVEMQLNAKRGSPLKHTLFAGYANGVLGYIPMPDAYPKPGQRVVTPDGVGHKLAFCMALGPECSGIVVDTGLELLAGLE